MAFPINTITADSRSGHNKQATAFSNAAGIYDVRTDTAFTQLLNLFNIKEADLTPAQREDLRMLFQVLIANDWIPGIQDGSDRYNQLYSVFEHSGLSAQAFDSRLGNNVNAAQAAYNLKLSLDSILYQSNGAVNNTVTNGADMSLVSQAIAQMLRDNFRNNTTSSITTVDFGTTSESVGNTISNLIQSGNYTETDRYIQSLQLTQASVRQLEDYTIAKHVEQASGGEVTASQFRGMNKEQQTRVIQNIRNNQESAWNKLTTEQRQQLVNESANSSAVQQAVAMGAKIGVNGWESESIINAAQYEMAKAIVSGNYKESMVSGDIKVAVESGISQVTETLQVLSEIFDSNDLNYLQDIANKLQWGSLTDRNNALNIKNRVSAAIVDASVTGRSVQSILKERSDIIDALAPNAGGTQFVSSRFAEQAQMLRQQVLKDQDPSNILKTPDEQVAALQRSYSNTEINFGAVADAMYVMENLPLNEKAKQELQGYIDTVQNGLKSGTQEGRANARVAALMLQESLNGVTRLDPAQHRKAQQQYASQINDLSVQNGATLFINKILEDMHGLDISEEQKQAISTTMVALRPLTGSSSKQMLSILHDFKRVKTDENYSIDDLIQDYTDQGLQASELQQLREAYTTYDSILSTVTPENLDKIVEFVQNKTPQAQVGSMTTAARKAVILDSLFKQSSQDLKKDQNFMEQIVAGFFGDNEGTINAEQWLNAKVVEYANSEPGNNDWQLSQSELQTLFNTEKVEGYALGQFHKDGTFDNIQAVLDSKLHEKLGLTEEQMSNLIKQEGILGLREFLANSDTGLALQVTANGQAAVVNYQQLTQRAMDESKKMGVALRYDWAEALKEDRSVDAYELVSILTDGQVTKEQYEAYIKNGKVSEDVVNTLNKVLVQNGSERIIREGYGVFSGKTVQESIDYLNKTTDGKTTAERYQDLRNQGIDPGQSTIIRAMQGLMSNTEGPGKILEELKNWAQSNWSGVASGVVRS